MLRRLTTHMATWPFEGANALRPELSRFVAEAGKNPEILTSQEQRAQELQPGQVPPLLQEQPEGPGRLRLAVGPKD